MLAGPRPEGLVPVEDLDRVLGAEAVAALVAAAKIPDGPVPFGAGSVSRREWFARALRGSVRRWAAEARAPTTREVAEELAALQRAAWDALCSGDAADLARVAAAYGGLSPEARAQVGCHGAPAAPTAAAVAAGDRGALELLFGLVPVEPGPVLGRHHPFGKGARYAGAGARELAARGRPRDARLEELARTLAVHYRLASGRLAGRGARAPFDHFFRLLLSFLVRIR
jgi:hypothetical protein